MSNRIMFFKALLYFLFCIVFPSLAFAQETTIQSIISADNVLTGEPVYATILIENTHVPSESVFVTSRIFLDLELVGPNGSCSVARKILCTRSNPWSDWIDTIFLSQEKPCWRDTIEITKYFIMQGNGKYSLIMSWKSKPIDDVGKKIVIRQLEKKHPSKTAVFLETLTYQQKYEFVVNQPTGVELSAYNYFKNSPLQPQNYAALLQKFPTSTYAAYAACPPNQWTSNTDPERILKSIETGTYLSNGSVPDDTGKSKDGWLYLGGRDLIDWRAKWIGIVLKNHPDIWFADELRLRLAMNQVALKNYQAAEADFIKLSKEAKPYVAEKAGLFVEIMKQKGWVSAPVEKSAPEAVVVK